VTYAGDYFNEGVDALDETASYLSAGDYDAFAESLYAGDFFTIVPLEELLLGSVAGF